MNLFEFIPILLETTTTPYIPDDYGIGSLVDVLMWIARALILAIGGGIGLVKIVKGKSDENPKYTTEGILSVAASGILFAATFAVEAAFK